MKKIGKKNISIVFIMFTILLLGLSCVEQLPKVLENKILSFQTTKINLLKSSFEFASFEKSSQTVKVVAENMKWEFADIPDWMTVTPISGSGDAEVKIEVNENTEAKTRVGLLSFRSVDSPWNYSTGVTVSQYRAPYQISLPVDTVQIGADGGNKTVKVETNTDTWTIVVPESMNWCTAIKTEEGLVLTITGNQGNESRRGVIELHTDDVSAFLTVTQHKAGVRTITDCVEFPMEGGLKTMALQVDAAWTIETSYSWLDVKTLSGSSGLVSIPIESTPNYSLLPRYGEIYIVISEDNKIEIPIQQEAIKFSVNPDKITVPSASSFETANVKSNLPWRFVTDSIPSWISVDPAMGDGNMQVRVNVKTNTSTQNRMAILPVEIFLQDDNNLLGQIYVSVVQNGQSFGADASAINFSDNAGTTYFNITSDGIWSIFTSKPWIDISPYGGEGNGTVQVNVTENLEGDSREGFILLQTLGQRDTIPVYQAGKYIDLSSKALSFQSNSDSAVVSLSANGQWTAESNLDWVVLSSVEGDGSCDLTVKVKDNPSTTSRSGEIIFSRKGNNPVRISVRQNGRYLNISSNYIVFFGKGGVSEPVIVQTDGKFDVQTESDWITINKETESQLTITTLENASSSSRSGVVSIYLTDLTTGSYQKQITVYQGGQFEAEYVDLGLSVYWATCNVGATTPEGYGYYYSWGEVDTRGRHNWLNYRWSAGTESSLTKYNSYVDYGYNGYVDYKTVLDPIDDVASVMWGGDWRMPTKDEFDELVNNCIWEWTTQEGVNGYKITSCIQGYTDNSIFLPASGAMWGSSVGSRGREGYYWQSNVAMNPYHSWNFHIRPNYFSVGDDSRASGFTVRPVKPSIVADAVSVILSRTAMSIKVGATDTILATIKQNYEIIGHDVQWSSSDENIAIISPTGVVEGIAPGMCKLTATLGSVQVECSVNVVSSTVTPEVVDLGLSVNWASFNVGADRPEGAGDFFAWGDIDTKSSYNLITYKYCDGFDYSNFTKYCNNSSWGPVDNKKILEPDDDIATTYLGEEWRMPTPMEVDELIQNCTWTWTSLNGVKGYRVTSNMAGFTDRSIFLPAVGARGVDKQMGVGFNGQYWTASCEEAGWGASWKLYFNQSTASRNAENRFYGYPIRPVTKKTSENSAMSIPDPVDLGLSVMWAPYNVGASSPEKTGYYYAWAETSPKMSYSYSTYKWAGSNKYNTNVSSSNVTSLKNIELVDDPANVNWGGDWRMPTITELDELWNNCDCYVEDYNGVSGFTMTSRINGNSIFIPASGVKQDANVVGKGFYCYMFASDLYFYNGSDGYYYSYWTNNDSKVDSFTRYTGVIVRPVYDGE